MKRNQVNSRLVLVSNRLPFTVIKSGSEVKIRPSTGGLITAINPVLSKSGGLWVGWPGIFEQLDFDDAFTHWQKSTGYKVQSVSLDKDEHDNFYHGFSNEILWPLFHDLQSRCNFFNTDYWTSYINVNRKFAEVVEQSIFPNDRIWVHDYQLINVGQELKKLKIKSKIAFFLHIPFPPPDIFFKLPWRENILNALLEYDLIGFQTYHDKNNFIQCVRILIKQAHCSSLRKEKVTKIQKSSKQTIASHFPIGIDYRGFVSDSLQSEVLKQAKDIRESFLNRQIILGVDRLDYTKGITCKLEAFRKALKLFPQLHQKIILIQILVPSRKDIPEYRLMKSEIERLVSEINGEFTKPGWVPINYIFNTLNRSELLAYYRAADIALVTPLKDGMNLVAKEYCATKTDGNGVLILSEFAGAADQSHLGALLVNPYSIEDVANKIYVAFVMNKTERQAYMRKIQKTVKRYDVFWWANSFLKTWETYSCDSKLKLIENKTKNLIPNTSNTNNNSSSKMFIKLLGK